jgi:hypothetical protein
VRDADGAAAQPTGSVDQTALQREFTATSLRDGIHRAVAWLESSPPARRELLVASRFPIGSISAADIAAIPAAIGIRLERSGALPAAQTVDAGRLLEANAIVALQATLDGPRTIVRETTAADRAAWPIEIVSPPAAQPAVGRGRRRAVAARLGARARSACARDDHRLGRDGRV